MELSWSRVLRGSSAVLALAAATSMAGQIVQVLGFPGRGTRATLEGFSQIANGVNGLLVLGAVLLLLAGRQLPSADAGDEGSRVWLVVGAILGAVIVAAAVYAVLDVLTIHIPAPAATGQSFQIGLASTHGGALRLAVILERGGGGLLAAWAVWLAVRTLRVSTPTPAPTAVSA